MIIPATDHPDDKHNLKRCNEALPGRRILARRSGLGEHVLSKDFLYSTRSQTRNNDRAECAIDENENEHTESCQTYHKIFYSSSKSAAQYGPSIFSRTDKAT